MFNWFGLFTPSANDNVTTAAAKPTNPNHAAAIADYLDLSNEAIVTQTIQPGVAGQVKFQGSWWTARCELGVVIKPGQKVYVVARLSSTNLYVTPMPVFSNWQ